MHYQGVCLHHLVFQKNLKTCRLLNFYRQTLSGLSVRPCYWKTHPILNFRIEGHESMPHDTNRITGKLFLVWLCFPVIWSDSSPEKLKSGTALRFMLIPILIVRGPPESPMQVETPAASAHCCRSVIVADGQTFLQSESLIHWVVIHWRVWAVVPGLLFII